MTKIYYASIILIIISCSVNDDFDGDLTRNSKSGQYSLSSNSYSTDGFVGGSVGDRYNDFEENPFIDVIDEPISTFSIDADGASYANARRFLMDNQLPPKEAIRTEELINYFQVDYPHNQNGHPVSLNGEISHCPWAATHSLIRIGLKGKTIPRDELPPSNIVLLVDVSGSMSSPDKLELLKEGFRLLIGEFTEKDNVAIVTYAGSAGVVLQPTPGDHKENIIEAINSLGSGGSTAGAQGIITAYELALNNFIEGGNNRVIIGTDGDFNVGPSSQDELVDLIEKNRDFGIFLTVLGVGRGNLNDGMLEQIANNGNGTYEYIDNIDQAKKVFIYEFSKFYTVAKDVKVQVEFNPDLVKSYRLIGYENRLLETEDFEDDKKDAGEIGAGQNITALYEIIHTSSPQLRYIPTFTIKFRYKEPDSEVSSLVDLEIYNQGNNFPEASENMRFVASVAGFGMLLRDSQFKGNLNYENIELWTSGALNYDPYNFRNEFRQLVTIAKGL